jgi:drug/metabolite transporter (DMT)-like permease
MKSRLWILPVVLAGLCWGTYVPLIAFGGKSLKDSYGAFLCVGVAYFLIAVLFPLGVMAARRRWPVWKGSGVVYSTLAGVAGALGALCVIFATFEFKGPRLYVAPLIFALAPVINTVFSLFWHPDEGALTFGLPRTKPHWTLYAGILLAGLGAGLVLYAKEATEARAREVAEKEAREKKEHEAKDKGDSHASAEKPPAPPAFLWVLPVVLAGLCWGTYVPLIAQGGKELKNSYAAFLCVGVAYFLIAILFPVAVMLMRDKWPAWNGPGMTFSTLSGVAGALGALCVIFATFEFKGPKLFVAPLIFALAPVINTVFSLFWHPDNANQPFGPPEVPPDLSLYFGIVAAGLGAGLVLFSKEYPEWLHARKEKEQLAAAPPAATAQPS